MEMKRVDVKDRISIPFEWKDMTPGGGNLGHAEFEVEIFYRRGKIVEFAVYPKQQRDANEYWVMTNPCPTDFTINSYNHLEDARVWIFRYCEKHKTPYFSLYVPANSSRIEIDRYGISFWR